MKNKTIGLLVVLLSCNLWAQDIVERVVRDETGSRIEIRFSFTDTSIPRGVDQLQVVVSTIYEENGQPRRTHFMNRDVQLTGTTILGVTVPPNMKGYHIRVNGLSGGGAVTPTQRVTITSSLIKEIAKQAEDVDEGWHLTLMQLPMGHFQSERYLTPLERMQEGREGRR